LHNSLTVLLGVWAIDWILSDLQPSPEYFAEHLHPKVHDWRTRFGSEIEQVKSIAPKPERLQGAEAVNAILTAEFTDKDLTVDKIDPLKMKPETPVELYPTDGGGYGQY
jgi:hypothetical protein